MVKLRAIRGPLEGQEFFLNEARVYIIGRENKRGPGAANEEFLALNSPNVSSRHAQLAWNGKAWAITDLKSYNGIRINKKKVSKGSLRVNDELDIAEFRFKVESALGATQVLPKDREAERTAAASGHSPEGGGSAPEFSIPFNPREQIAGLKERARNFYQKLDFKYRVIALMLLGGFLLHFMVFQSLSSEASRRFLDESRKNARLLAENLGERSKMSLAKGDLLLECEGFGRRAGAVQSYVLNREGEVLCPIGTSLPRDELLLEALRTHEIQDSCGYRLQGNEGDLCEIVYPVKVLVEGSNVPDVVGFTRILYEPLQYNRAIQKFSQIRFQTLMMVLVLAVLLGLLVIYWLREGIQRLTDEVHLLYAGTAQSVDTLQSFASFDQLVDEINRLISKVNQGLSADSGGLPTEAGFLQPLLDQVFLLEERAVMAVDPDNQVLAISGLLRDLVPLRDDYINLHITEAVEDTHLQGELMGFLNELSLSQEVTDKALSATDRIIQSRGMPVVISGRHVVTILFFYG